MIVNAISDSLIILPHSKVPQQNLKESGKVLVAVTTKLGGSAYVPGRLHKGSWELRSWYTVPARVCYIDITVQQPCLQGDILKQTIKLL